jgi:hypothetical protein
VTGRRRGRALVDLPRRPLPAPPEWLRRGPARAEAFTSRLRSPRLASQLGIALGVAFAVCFGTGLISHLIQHPPGWFGWPSRPVNLYRVTQGLHVATGLASIPLLAAKLWSVYPRLFEWPPVRHLAHAVERASVAVLVAAALFELVTGVLNIARRYDLMPFAFPPAHYWTAWLAVGALLTHLGVKLPVVRDALRRSSIDHDSGPTSGRLTRRGVLGLVAGASGLITVATVGQTVAPLARVSVLAPRRPGTGPQHLPVNRSAAAAGVLAAATDPGYRLVVAGPHRTVHLSLAELDGLPRVRHSLPIACVEGWSADASWTGVRLRDLVELVGVDPRQASVMVTSLQPVGAYRTSDVAPPHVRDPLTLLALHLNGERLGLDHGYPCRLIAPNRPGVLQTKWVASLTVRQRP